jgi:hypothetical protein
MGVGGLALFLYPIKKDVFLNQNFAANPQYDFAKAIITGVKNMIAKRTLAKGGVFFRKLFYGQIVIFHGNPP